MLCGWNVFHIIHCIHYVSQMAVCSAGMCVPVGKHSGGSWKRAPSVCWSVEGSRCGAGEVPIPALPGEWFAGI